MGSDTAEFWNGIWSTMGHTFADHDELLVYHAGDLNPGRALDLGCGSGGNAVWLAERGWRVTAVDFSEVALAEVKRRAADSRVEVELVVSDVAAYRQSGLYDPDYIVLHTAMARAAGVNALQGCRCPSFWGQASLRKPRQVVTSLRMEPGRLEIPDDSR